MHINAADGQQALGAFEDYWQELLLTTKNAGGVQETACPVPQRSAFNPMKIHTCLPYIYVTEMLSDDMIEIRLSGSAIDDNAGQSLKGSNFLDICEPGERAIHVKICRLLITWPCGIEMVRRTTRKDGRIHQYKSISYPFADNVGVPRYIVGIADVAENVAVNLEFGHKEKIKTEIVHCNFVDIGAGVPPNPVLPKPE